MRDFPARFEAAVDSGATLIATAEPSDFLAQFARSVAAGLSDEPKWLHCQYLYDAEGSRLFERITEQPEYYPTSTEASILAESANEIRDITGLVTLVELGSGLSVKTEYLLNAYTADRLDVLYVPIDVSETALREASRSIATQFPTVQVTGINGTYGSAFSVLEQLSPQLIVFLGSTIGNFNEEEAALFWRRIAKYLPKGDFFLLGVDLVKDAEILEAAYNDAAGVTAQFTKNLWSRINRELGAEIDTDEIEHVAIWNDASSRMEISSRFNTAQEVYLAPLDQTFEIDAGQQVLIEISRKFRLPDLESELGSHGFEVRRTFTDPKGWFALLLLQRVDRR